MPIRQSLAEKLKEARKKEGLSPEEVGRIIGRSKQTIYAWESGRGQPDADMLVNLAHIYKISSIAYFYGNYSEKMIDKNIGELTETEQLLLFSYRALDESGKRNVFEIVSLLLKNANDSTNKDELT